VILHTEWDFHTYQCNFDSDEFDLYRQSVLSTHTRVCLTRMRVNMILACVISTRSSWISERSSGTFTQSVISTGSVILTGTNVIPTRRV
jgi:hypothetical protein